jgi:hypothetical protein
LLGPVAVVLFIGWVFCSVGNDVGGDTAAREILPTAARATAAGACAVAATLGGASGLACEAGLFGAFGSHWVPVRALAFAGLLMPLII